MFRTVRHCTAQRATIDLDFLAIQQGIVEQTNR
jgi:hypothetical protein